MPDLRPRDSYIPIFKDRPSCITKSAKNHRAGETYRGLRGSSPMPSGSPHLVRREYGDMDVLLPRARSAAVLAVTSQHDDRFALHLKLAAAARARCFHPERCGQYAICSAIITDQAVRCFCSASQLFCFELCRTDHVMIFNLRH